MNIVSLNWHDFGGLSYQLCRAINRLTDHRAWNIAKNRQYTRKPLMIQSNPKMRDRIRRLIRNADVLHVNESMLIATEYSLGALNLRGKKAILHAHGTPFRVGAEKIKRFWRRWLPPYKIIAGTPDLLEKSKGAWFPSIVPIEALRAKYKTRRNNPPIIYYSPTKIPEYWDLGRLQAATTTLKNEGLRFHVNVRSDITHRLNMELKSKADIYFDELKIFYGVNALEGAAFGLAVVHGMSPFCNKYMKKRKTKQGFNSVATGDVQGLTGVLRGLVKDRKRREAAGKRAYKYVKKIHSPEACVKRFLSLVE